MNIDILYYKVFLACHYIAIIYNNIYELDCVILLLILCFSNELYYTILIN